MKHITDIEEISNLLKIGNYDVMHRVNYNGRRLYISENPFRYYSGLTGALSAATFKGDPSAKRLSSWRDDRISELGKEGFNIFMDEMADFGTLTHEALVTIQNNGQINWSEEEDKAWDYFINGAKKRDSVPSVGVIRKMVYEYLKQVGSLMQFIHERVHEIYAIEVPARWEELHIATPIDLFCSCRQTPKGDFKKTTINLKTSKQISDHQLEQASCEMDMWNETYSDAECTAILRGKNWKDGNVPTFEYKYLDFQQAEEIAEEVKRRLELCLTTDATYLVNPISKSFKGVTKVGETPEIITETLEEQWTNREE